MPPRQHYSRRISADLARLGIRHSRRGFGNSRTFVIPQGQPGIERLRKIAIEAGHPQDRLSHPYKLIADLAQPRIPGEMGHYAQLGTGRNKGKILLVIQPMKKIFAVKASVMDAGNPKGRQNARILEEVEALPLPRGLLKGRLLQAASQLAASAERKANAAVETLVRKANAAVETVSVRSTPSHVRRFSAALADAGLGHSLEPIAGGHSVKISTAPGRARRALEDLMKRTDLKLDHLDSQKAALARLAKKCAPRQSVHVRKTKEGYEVTLTIRPSNPLRLFPD